MELTPAGYLLAVFTLVIGFAAGVRAGVMSDYVRDWFYILRVWVTTGLSVCGVVFVMYLVAHFGYGMF